MSEQRESAQRPNVIVILADDMGFSDIGCYGGEVETPNIDKIATDGAILTQFYNTARCSPSRASLMTGLHPHQTGIGILNYDDSPEGYPGTLNGSCVTIAEALKPGGYRSYMVGKWHMASDIHSPTESWPTRRGFDEFYGTLEGAGSYFQPRTLTHNETNVEADSDEPEFYYTDVISRSAVEAIRSHRGTSPEDPFFLYVGYTAPHWPLHALPEDRAVYRGRFDLGWDVLREQRLRRQIDKGIISARWPLSDRDARVPPWESVEDKEWEAGRMEVYAAQIHSMDRGVGRILDELDAQGIARDTIVIFLSDNGGCAEEIPFETAGDFVKTYVTFDAETRDGRPVRAGNDVSIAPGGEDTYASYGRSWANLSNSPFREYKHWVHEGGISTPFLIRWPGRVSREARWDQPHQLTDVMSTILDAAGIDYPEWYEGRAILPEEGVSILPGLVRGERRPGRALFWEHEGNAAVRIGDWKLVRKFGLPWELYDMAADRTELEDVSAMHPDVVGRMKTAYAEWSERCGVIPRQNVLDLYQARGSGLPPE